MTTANARDYTDVSIHLSNDLYEYLSQSGECFECLVYKANIDSEGEQTDDFEEVGTLEQKETKLTYQGYIKTRAVESPRDLESHSISAMGD